MAGVMQWLDGVLAGPPAPVLMAVVLGVALGLVPVMGWVLGGTWRALGRSRVVLRQRRLERQRRRSRAARRYVSPATKYTTWVRAGGVCEICQRGDYLAFEYDHDVPVAKGGDNRLSNIRLLCRECNRRKGVRLGWPAMESVAAPGRGVLTFGQGRWRWRPVALLVLLIAAGVATVTVAGCRAVSSREPLSAAVTEVPVLVRIVPERVNNEEEIIFTLEGSGFRPGLRVEIGPYQVGPQQTPESGMIAGHVELRDAVTVRVTLGHRALAIGDYGVLMRNPDGHVSNRLWVVVR